MDIKTQDMVTKFEELKKRRDNIMLERAKEEARLETLTRELDALKESLSEYGVVDELSARELLERTSSELAVELHDLEQALQAYDNAQTLEA